MSADDGAAHGTRFVVANPSPLKLASSNPAGCARSSNLSRRGRDNGRRPRTICRVKRLLLLMNMM
jgi:hypothetical protein